MVAYSDTAHVKSKAEEDTERESTHLVYTFKQTPALSDKQTHGGQCGDCARTGTGRWVTLGVQG